ncbi:MAG: DUF3352 domain-containing protein [Leptolyngbyaceae cyanobacterium SL_1_1]|nr:DUF3352 domain-containing protein [Leptolyngbyaceae cyanobacterium SL_1_1]
MKTGLLSTAIALMVSAVSASAAETPPSAPSAFDLLPEDTPMTLILDTTDETWSQLSQFQLFSLVKAYTGTDPNLGGLPYLPLEIPYETAVAPWIGDSAVLALMPLPDETAKLQNQSLLAAPIANFAAFDGFLEQIAAARNEDFVEEPYRNVAIYVWPPRRCQPLSSPTPRLHSLYFIRPSSACCLRQHCLMLSLSLSLKLSRRPQSHCRRWYLL